MAFGLPSHGLPEIPKVPDPPKPDAVPAHVGQDVGSGLAQGNVGIGAPQHFDPNNPSVRLDGTVHNPTGVGGDLQVSREVSANDLKNIPSPNIHAPDLSLPGGGSGSSGGSGFSLPSLPSMPSLPSLGMPDVSLPSLSMPGLPDLPSAPSLGNPFSGLSAPSLPSLPDMPGLPDLPSFGLPSLPGMPGFRFPDLPEFSLPDFDLSGWDLTMPDLVPDWEGDSEEERATPHKRAKHQDKVTVELRLKAENGQGVPFAHYTIELENGDAIRGNLNEEGVAKIEIPRGGYSIRYDEDDEVQATLVAICIADSVKCGDVSGVFKVVSDHLRLGQKIRNNFDRYIRKRGDSRLVELLTDLSERKGCSFRMHLLMREAQFGIETIDAQNSTQFLLVRKEGTHE